MTIGDLQSFLNATGCEMRVSTSVAGPWRATIIVPPFGRSPKRELSETADNLNDAIVKVVTKYRLE